MLVLWSLAAQLAFDSGTLLDYSDPAASLLLATGGTVLVGCGPTAASAGACETCLRPTRRRSSSRSCDPRDRASLEPTAIIAGYRIEAAIGRGGMGVVYRATQLALERPVAIKLIATERSQDPVFRSRFKLESRLAASIEHANVIPVYEAGEDDGLLFIAMRLVEGTDLAQLLARLGTLEPAKSGAADRPARGSAGRRSRSRPRAPRRQAGQRPADVR